MSLPLSGFLLITAFSTTLLAVSIPIASDKRADNLQHYLDYRLEAKSIFSCEAQTSYFRCLSKDHKYVETDESNNTIESSFKEAELRFSKAIAPLLEKASFQMTMDEIEKKLNGSKDGRASKNDETPSTTREDALHRALIGNLDVIRIDSLDIRESDPSAHIRLDELIYTNEMSPKAKDITFTERIFGDISIHYKNATIENDESDAFYQTLPMMLEEWLGTDDKNRAKYVGERLQGLYADQLTSPTSGDIRINSKYIGADTISLLIDAKSSNRDGASGTFELKSELQNISTLVKQSNKALVPGTPDVLFHSLHATSKMDVSKYRALLKHDKQFAAYMHEYEQSLLAYLDEKVQGHRKNTILMDWTTQMKNAIKQLVRGEANTVKIHLKNSSGVTAMQLFGMVMGQMMTMPATGDERKTPMEKVITDTATQNLDLRIEALHEAW